MPSNAADVFGIDRATIGVVVANLLRVRNALPLVLAQSVAANSRSDGAWQTFIIAFAAVMRIIRHILSRESREERPAIKSLFRISLGRSLQVDCRSESE